jgi:hypothetical protein
MQQCTRLKENQGAVIFDEIIKIMCIDMVPINSICTVFDHNYPPLFLKYLLRIRLDFFYKKLQKISLSSYKIFKQNN